jgi:hypothetical protein
MNFILDFLQFDSLIQLNVEYFNPIIIIAILCKQQSIIYIYKLLEINHIWYIVGGIILIVFYGKSGAKIILDVAHKIITSAATGTIVHNKFTSGGGGNNNNDKKDEDKDKDNKA